MNSSRQFRLAAASLVVWSTFGLTQVCWADHRGLYVEGLRSFEFEKWQEALMLFEAARREQPLEGEWIRPYGMRFEAYLPYYYLGACLYRLKKYEQALASWAESERQGAILENRNKYWWRQLQVLRRDLEVEIPSSAKILKAEIASALQELIKARATAADRYKSSEFDARLQEIEVVLVAISNELERMPTAALIERARDQLNQAWSSLEATLVAIRELERDAALAELARAEAERQRLLDTEMHRARELLSQMKCSPDAIEILLDVHSKVALVETESSMETGLYLLLTKAYFQCDDLILAEHYHRLAQSRDSFAPSVLALGRQLAKAKEDRQVLRQYQDAEERISKGHCSREAIEIVEALIQGGHTPSESPWGPLLLLSDGYLQCADFEGALAYLSEARERGRAPVELLASLESEIRAQQYALDETQKRAARVAVIEEASKAIASGDCKPGAIDILEDHRREQRSDVVLESRMSMLLEIARGYLACGDPQGAERTLQDIQSAKLRDQEPLISLGRAVRRLRAEQVQQAREQQALSDYLVGLARIRLGECSEEVMILVEGARKALDELGARDVDAEYAPYLALAQAQRNCGDPRQARNFLRLARKRQGDANAEVAEIETWLKQTEVYDESYALLIAAYDYDQGWEPLKGPDEDVQAIRAVLERHEFKVQVIKNPSSTELAQQIRLFFSEHGKNLQNRLLFYYAGHGWTQSKHGIKLGYIVPVDAPHPEKDPNYLTYLISMDNFEGYAKEIDARHVLFLFDSCFSGTVFDATKSTVEAQVASLSVEEVIAKPVRLFITAGDETQLVPDFSVFRETVVQALEGEADFNQDGHILGSEIGRFVRAQVTSRSRTTPQWGKMSVGELGLGDILFKNAQVGDDRASAEYRGALASELEYWMTLGSSNDPELYRSYLRTYPGGHFAPLARRILDSLSAQTGGV